MFRSKKPFLPTTATALWAAIGAAFIIPHSPVALIPATEAQSIRDTQDELIAWVDTRKVIAATEAGWLAEKAIVTDLIALLENEKIKLESNIEKLSDRSDATDARRAELNESRERLMATTDTLNAFLPKLEANIRSLVEKLPDPLVAELSPLLARLPEPDKETRLPLSQRLLTVVGILNRVDKFNTAITITTEIRNVGERSVEVKTLYFGLAGAYFASAAGDYTGLGQAGDSGWVWTEDAALSRDITNLIRTYEGSREATFVQLPVKAN